MALPTFSPNSSRGRELLDTILREAKAVLKDANGTTIGVVNLYQASNLEPVKITADLKGLGEGKKGFHVQ